MSLLPDLKGSSFTLSVLHLTDNDISKTLTLLKEKITQAPAFFAFAPVVINVSQVKEDIDFSQLKHCIHEVGMVPVGIAGAKDKRTQNQATAAGFAVMTASKAPSQAPAEMQPAKVVRHPIRSGQQIYAKDADLVILNHVSPGAEVIADGSIHIHGNLKGRAIAGASGQKEAKIICNNLQAELVSIAGNYWLSEQIAEDFWQQKVILSYNDETLHVDKLTI
ncbi:septum site-determining protein MinC [Vibrio quintilis]|uniref:Probable septum site-determining protein MinC n=1 Tax=Vibrio quintilis TaxID=1117707 RepID=A0A1M7Z0C0_9VIBR|nr:septum site-determining protein MinC [Vibrio quintilis]SHO58320.1 Septum site-determining protein MinC [Vibrio quintilis]